MQCRFRRILDFVVVEYTLEVEQETDGRWIAEVPELPGVMVYGATKDKAVVKAEALDLRVIADRRENREVLV